jgi:hypothetical protein
MILGMLFEFGITKAMDFIKGKIKDINPICPENPEKIKELIRRRNKLVKQLNNLYKVVDTLTISLGLINNTVTTAEILFNTLKFTPIPTPPPAVPSLVPLIQDTKSTVDSNIKKFSNISKGLLTILIIIRDLLQQILDLLSFLDENIQKCTSDADLIGIAEIKTLMRTKQPTTINNNQPTPQSDSTTNISILMDLILVLKQNLLLIILNEKELSLKMIKELYYYEENTHLVPQIKY